jgi:phosphomevalonate kinase
MTSTVRAPGKAMIFGEYAVLDGAPAVVAAISRDAVARLDAAAPAPGPFVAAAVARARADLLAAGREPPAQNPRIDSRALYDETRKLGLGSSAAVTVAAYGSVLAGAGVGFADRERIFRACDEAHGEAQGARGSGADVAAAVWGGFLEFRAGGPAAPLAWPASLELHLFDSGEAASTADRVGRYRRHAAEASGEHKPLADLLAALSGELLGALREAPSEVLDLVERWNDALDELGAALDVEILTPAHRRIARAARAAGGAAKPSGAGGGDLAIAFAPQGGGDELQAAVEREGFRRLDLTFGGPGLEAVTVENHS